MNLHNGIRSFQRLLGLMALLLTLVLGSAAQAANFNLKFTNPGTCPAAASGANAAVGSSCRYTNVVVDSTGTALPTASVYQRDVIVTLSKLTGGAVVTGTATNTNAWDNDAVQLDGAGAAHPEFFTPTVTAPNTANTVSWAEFTFQFVPAGGSSTVTTPLPGSFYMTSFDTDGNGAANSLREFIEFVGPSASGVSSTPASADQLGTAVDGGVNYEAIAITNQAAIGSGAAYKASAQFATPGIVKFAVGARQGTAGCGGAAGCERLSTYSFQVADSVLLYPAVDGYKSVKLTTDADGNGAITPGDTLTYTVTYVNTGNAAETGFQITDALPAGVTAAAGAQTVRVNGTVTAGAKNAAYTGAGANTGLLAAGQTLAVNGTISVDIPVTVGAVAADNTVLSNQAGSSGTYTNAAGTSVAAPAVSSDNADTTTVFPPSVAAATGFGAVPAGSVAQTQAATTNPTTVNVRRLPQLTLNKTIAAPGRINAADQFTVQIKNGATVTASASTTGTGTTAATAATLLASGTSYTLTEIMAAGSVSALASYDTAIACTNTASGSTTTLPTGAGQSFTLTPALGDVISCTLTNTAKQADLSVTKTADKATYAAGENVIYTVTASNAGPNPAGGAVVADTLPTQTVSLGWTCAASGGAVCPNASGSGNVNQTIATYPSGGKVIYTITALAKTTATGIVNTATVTAPATVLDPATGNNTAAATIAITNPAAGAAYPGPGPVSKYATCLDFSAMPSLGIGQSYTSNILTPDGVTIFYTVAVTNAVSSAAGAAAGAATDGLSKYVPGTWQGDRWQQYFGTGKTNAVANNVNGRQVFFTVSAYAQLGTLAVPITLLTGSAEDDGGTSGDPTRPLEYTSSTTNGTPFSVADVYTTGGIGRRATLTNGGTTETMTISSSDGAGNATQVNILILATTKTNATSASPLTLTSSLLGTGVTAQAFCASYGYDRGDAPATYGASNSLLAPTYAPSLSDGFRTLDQLSAGTRGDDTSVYLGAGKPSAEDVVRGTNGTGDTDDGVASFPTLSTASTTYSTTVAYNNTSGGSATLSGWIDFNRNGTFDAGEKATTTVAAGSGNATLTWSGLTGLVKGQSYARFRISTDATSAGLATGTSPNGEVEDYALTIQNNPPTTVNVTNAVLLDTAAATVLNPNLSAADTDGTIASYTIVTIPAAASGVLALNGTAVTVGQTFTAAQLAQLTFDPAAGFSGNATFTYSATDDSGAVSNTSTYTLPVNRPPTTANVTNAVLLDSAAATTLSPNLSAADPDGTVASYTIVTIPAAASGVLALNGTAVTAGQTFTAAQLAQLTFDPATGFSGNATFTYSATDNLGATSNTSTYTIPVNRPPTTANVTNAAVVNTAAAATLTPNLSATDPDGTVASYTIVTIPAAASGVLALNGTAVTAGQTFTAAQLAQLTFDPAAGFSGNATFTYRATDNLGAVSNTSTYTIPVNNPPTTANVTNAVLPDTAPATVLSPNLSAADTDGTIASYTIVTIPAAASGVLALNGTAVTAGQTFTAAQLGTLTFDPAAGFNGSATFTYSATDNQGAVSNTSTYIIPVNVAPVAVNDTSSTPANTAKTFSITGNDTDTAPGTVAVATTVFAATGQPTGSTLTNANRTITVPGEGSYTLDNSGNVTFTPVSGYSGTTTAVKYTVQDNNGATSNTANITVTVTPVAVNDTASTAPSTLVNIPVLTNDVGTGKVLTSLLFPAGGQPTGSTVTNGGKTLTNADGVYTINSGGTVDFTPALGKTGTLTPVLYTFVDGAGQTSNAATITVTVSNIVPPTAVSDSKTTPKNTAVTLEGSTNDTANSLPIDNTSVVFPTAGQPTGATVSNGGKTLTFTGQGTYQVQTNGTVIFTPVGTFAGTTTPVLYTVKDTSGATSNTATLTVTVTNQPPVANNVTNVLVTSTAAAAVLNPGVSGTDPDGSVVTYTITALPTAAMGTLYCNGTAIASVPSACAPAQLSFKPNPAYNGNATFQYTVTDDNGATSAAATYTIPVNKPPVAVNDTAATDPGVSITFSVTGNDTDTAPGTVDVTTTAFDASSIGTISNAGKTLTVTGEGVYTLDNTGKVTFAPAAGFNNGASTAKYTVKDNNGAVSNVATITVTVPASVDLGLTKTGPAYFKPGDTLSYTLTVTNSGSAATGVTVTDTLPTGLTFVSASNSGSYNAGTGKVTWTLGNVANGATVSLTLTGTAPTAASVETNNGPTSLANTATTAANETEVVTGNNSATTTAQLVYPKLSKRVRNVTQSGAFGTVGTGKPGEVLEYCIDFKNYGVAVASFVITDTVPSNTNADLSAYGSGLGLQVVRGSTTTRTSTGSDADGGSLSSTTLSLNLGSLAAGESGNVCFRSSIK